VTSSLRKKEALTAWLFITPYLIGFTLFHFLPVLLSAVLSLTDMRYISMIDKTHLIGLGNYIEMSRDPEFWNAFYSAAANEHSLAQIRHNYVRFHSSMYELYFLIFSYK